MTPTRNYLHISHRLPFAQTSVSPFLNRGEVASLTDDPRLLPLSGGGAHINRQMEEITRKGRNGFSAVLVNVSGIVDDDGRADVIDGSRSCVQASE